jgi:hypothetical protein
VTLQSDTGAPDPDYLDPDPRRLLLGRNLVNKLGDRHAAQIAAPRELSCNGGDTEAILLLYFFGSNDSLDLRYLRP